ncbi:hypothetical protein H8356DRAFT_1090361 [Neocallimastix lanati (nom. inval.)]|uniref:Uncharacterized protein n=1 Tax=Neocallimastix californiae TaxID=1754190 RepID=A0A1Y1YRM0_9FUNG|nr:hypothetical protein H8356DRAFT_1090361 [Neocallimastix sp. JGI-2020a]ORY00464.1 hypothetical protein LY90DRAFT_519807 [Neocallimastix californiae]|eukprot:ORY00464.1 hypothetical protein LY90DRAFT_519807 [Neocallimastix californiae]
MKLFHLLLILLFIMEAYCSSQNHTPTDNLIKILAAVNELCIHKPQDCLPKMDDKNNLNPLPIEIGKDLSSNPIMGTIYDIFPELRKLEKGSEVNNFFQTVLFKYIKEIIDDEYGVQSIDIDDIENENIQPLLDNINKYLNDNDIIAELLNTQNKENADISLFNDDNVKKLYIYPPSNKPSYIYEILKFLYDTDPTSVLPDNKGSTNYNDKYNKNPNLDHIPQDVISFADLSGLLSECKNNFLCKNYFPNPYKINQKTFKDFYKNFQIDIFQSNLNDGKRLHLIIGDKTKEVNAHLITVKKEQVLKSDGTIGDKYIVDTNFYPKEIYFNKNIYIDDLNNHMNVLNSIFTRVDANGNTIFDEYLNKCNRINQGKKFNQLSKKEKTDITSEANELEKEIYDRLDEYSSKLSLNLSNEQKARFAIDMGKKINEKYNEERKSNANVNLNYNIFDQMMNEILQKEKDFYDHQSKIFDFNIIRKVLSNNPYLSNEELSILSNMLNTHINGLTNSEINNLVNELTQYKNDKDVSHSANFNINNHGNIKSIFSDISNRSNLETHLKNINQLSFCSINNNRKNVESITKCFNREYYKLFSDNSPLNESYIKSKLLGLNIMTGMVFRDPTPKFNGNLYIPQANSVDLGTYVTKYKMEPY